MVVHERPGNDLHSRESLSLPHEINEDSLGLIIQAPHPPGGPADHVKILAAPSFGGPNLHLPWLSHDCMKRGFTVDNRSSSAFLIKGVSLYNSPPGAAGTAMLVQAPSYEERDH